MTYIVFVFDLRNNAGKFTHEHAISEDGVEMTFATNYLGKLFKYIIKLVNLLMGF